MILFSFKLIMTFDKSLSILFNMLLYLVVFVLLLRCPFWLAMSNFIAIVLSFQVLCVFLIHNLYILNTNVSIVYIFDRTRNNSLRQSFNYI